MPRLARGMEIIMKKRILFIISLLLILAGCNTTPKVEITKEYLIPNSFFEFTNTNIESANKSIVGLGNDYYTKTECLDNGLRLVLTDIQRDNLIRRNNDFINELIKSFKNENIKYSVVTDSTNKNLKFYFDENLSAAKQIKAVFGVATGYGYNLLLSGIEDWNVKIEIYNCHTNKLVASGNIPNEEFSYGDEEWRKSYNE